MAVGGYRLLRRPASRWRNLAVGRWVLDMGMIGCWTEIFFRHEKLGPSAVAPGAMAASGAAYVAAAARTDRTAALSGTPYVAWLGFATLLAERIWERDRLPHRRIDQPNGVARRRMPALRPRNRADAAA